MIECIVRFMWYFWADTSVGKKRVEDVMPIATGHEREELEAELEVCQDLCVCEILVFAIACCNCNQ